MYAIRSYYDFTISEATTVTFATNSGADPYLRLAIDDGSLDLTDKIAYNDDGGPGLQSLIVANLAPGNYVLAVSGWGFDDSEFVSGINTSYASGADGEVIGLSITSSIPSALTITSGAEYLTYVEDNATDPDSDGTYTDGVANFAIGFTAAANRNNFV